MSNDFNEYELRVIRKALICYDEIKNQYIISMGEVADSLRKGERVPLFAEGEEGASVAEDIVDFHKLERQRLNTLIDDIEDMLQISYEDMG